jgi:hypothetical protein
MTLEVIPQTIYEGFAFVDGRISVTIGSAFTEAKEEESRFGERYPFAF